MSPNKHQMWTIRLLGRLLALAVCVLLATSAQAAGKVSVSVGQVQFGDLQIDGLEAGWAPRADSSGALTLRTARIRGIAATGPLSGFALDCPELQIDGDRLHCA
ncbi:MAG: hypothetical protein ACREJC_19400, partial [Tepidisphaeraceae bacterium]